jgi:hypothetical protein
MGSRATGVKETIARSNKRLTPKTAQLKIHLCLLLTASTIPVDSVKEHKTPSYQRSAVLPRKFL